MKNANLLRNRKMSDSCKAQDVLVLLKLLTIGEEPWTFTRLSKSLFLSVGASHKAVTHLRAAGLVFERGGDAVVARRRAADFLVHGVPAIFFPVRGGMDRGIPTSTSAPMLSKLAGKAKADLAPVAVVWPSPAGKVTGETLLPIYATAPKAAMGDSVLYELLALVDGVRVGKGKERRLCADALYMKVAGEPAVAVATAASASE